MALIRRAWVVAAVLGLLSLIAGGCASEPFTPEMEVHRVFGEAAVPSLAALPRGAIFEASLLEVVDGRARSIGHTSVQNPAGLPVSFNVSYNPRVIEETRRYQLVARLVIDNRVAYVTAEPLTIPPPPQTLPPRLERRDRPKQGEPMPVPPGVVVHALVLSAAR